MYSEDYLWKYIHLFKVNSATHIYNKTKTLSIKCYHHELNVLLSGKYHYNSEIVDPSNEVKTKIIWKRLIPLEQSQTQFKYENSRPGFIETVL